MSYLSQPTSVQDYGVVRIGDYIEVVDGIISGQQDLAANASPTFANISVSGNLTANGNLVVTSVTPAAGDGITLSDIVTDGYAASFTVTNTGVLSLVAGAGISLSANTGNITISSTGADLIHVYGTTTNYTATNEDEYIGVNSTGSVTITLPTGIEGRVYTIKDEHGQGAGKITVKPTGSEKIDNSNAYIISVPYQSVSVVFRAGQWRLI